MNKNSIIYVAGHGGMVGSALWRLLKNDGYSNLVFAGSDILDLRVQRDVEAFFETKRPEYVFLAAAKVGGILANSTRRAEFLYDNLMITSNIIHASFKYEVKKLLFLGSSCIYPKDASQPIQESSLLTGPMEETNEPYAIAKIAGIKLCETYRDQYNVDFISAMPTNLYGPNDNYDLQSSHVLPALVRKIHSAKIRKLDKVEIWGTGRPLREFLHVDDLAKACKFLMENYSDRATINVGSGKDLSIIELTETIKEIIKYEGKIVFDTSMPDGMYRKLLDSSKILNLGWKPEIDLKSGILEVYHTADKTGW